MLPGALSLFAPPYRWLESVTDPKTFSGRLRSNPGAAALWSLEEGDWGSTFDLVRTRPGGVALIVVLPRAEDAAQDREVLRVVELCRPHNVEGLECRLRILERENRVEELKATLGKLKRIPQKTDLRVRCLAASVQALGMIFGDGRGSLDAAALAYRLSAETPYADLEDRMLHRLILVHFHGGTLNIGNGKQLLEMGLSRATKSDALKTRYGFLEAAGLWHLESAEYTYADRYFRQAEGVMESAPEVSDKVQMFANQVEQFAMGGRMDLAREYYGRARDALRPRHHWRTHQTVYGGLGYCALELGDLRLARDCEAALDYTAEAYFDPWMIILFPATLLRRRGDPDGSGRPRGSSVEVNLSPSGLGPHIHYLPTS